MIGHDNCFSVLKRECDVNTTAVVCAAKNPGQGIYQVSVVTIDDLAGDFKSVRTPYRLAFAFDIEVWSIRFQTGTGCTESVTPFL